jgi:hypothetical protein
LAILVVLEAGDIATAPLPSRAGIVAALCITAAGIADTATPSARILRFSLPDGGEDRRIRVTGD